MAGGRHRLGQRHLAPEAPVIFSRRRLRNLVLTVAQCLQPEGGAPKPWTPPAGTERPGFLPQMA